jgi:hypothetical protein
MDASNVFHCITSSDEGRDQRHRKAIIQHQGFGNRIEGLIATMLRSLLSRDLLGQAENYRKWYESDPIGDADHVPTFFGNTTRLSEYRAL